MVSLLLRSRVKKNLKKLQHKKAILLMDNAPMHPDVEKHTAENITCIFIGPKQKRDFAVDGPGRDQIYEMRYRKQLLSKFLFEGDDYEEEAACSIVQFWKA
ncbi:hypothetical protein AVEN_22823-1 [Araneus ventricosus]|uniref:DDE-1 domain-containing protein n=1 Tax=Araneus ventricosus TaxID=182803 RepID=A0A4Y2TMF1_ARAVE|nr:hypothetical protein AVEN_22823-1 [Araneus ventricosus]